jgi:hypothetical protein
MRARSRWVGFGRTVIVCLLIGAVMNLAAALVCWFRWTSSAGGAGASGSSPLAGSADVALWRSPVPSEWPDPSEAWLERPTIGVERHELLSVINEFTVLSVDEQEHQRQVDARESYWLLSMRFGWPFPVLALEHWRFIRGFTLQLQATNAITIADRRLPGRIVWAGLCAGSLVYALPMLMIPLLLRPLRARRRRRRGCCMSCGYDLRGEFDAGCPECGWNRTAPSPPAPATAETGR